MQSADRDLSGPEYKQAVCCIDFDAGTYLWHLYLLYGADHVCCFFAPVTLNYVALYGCAINRNNGMSSCLMGVEPAHKQES